MNRWLNRWHGVLAVLAFILSAPALADELKADRDFRLLNPPLAVDAKDKIEVTEFFWYGCPHCFDFEPVLATWIKKLPKDVAFRRVPTIFPNNKWAPGARLYYTLEAMNLLDKFHVRVFNAIHLDRERLDNEEILFKWIAKEGVDPEAFRKAWNSFAVMTRVQQARQLTAAAGITGVPAVIVQGRYAALTPGTYDDFVKVIDQIVERVRAESAPAGAGRK